LASLIAVGRYVMKKRLRIVWLLVACLSLPLLSRARSRGSSDVVSVRELSIPPKAHHAFEQGIEFLAKKDAAGSLPHFQRAVAEYAAYYEAYHKIGEANLKLWRISDAEQSFRKSIDLSGGLYAPSLLALGAVLDSQKKFSEAEEVTRKGLDLYPASWSGHFYLALALFGLNRLEDAEKSVREALGLKNDFAEAHLLLVRIHSRERDYRALVNDLDNYLKIDPDSPASVRVRDLRDSAQRMLVESQNPSALAEPQL
jgi:tetratricopeptide (TPR) repeat protein